MTEDKVRRAAEVALEYAKRNEIPEGSFNTIFGSVFQAMIREPWPESYGNMTATGAQILNEKSDATTTE